MIGFGGNPNVEPTKKKSLSLSKDHSEQKCACTYKPHIIFCDTFEKPDRLNHWLQCVSEHIQLDCVRNISTNFALSDAFIRLSWIKTFRNAVCDDYSSRQNMPLNIHTLMNFPPKD